MGTSTLEKELVAFEAAKPGLLPHELGRFALVRDGHLIDTFDTQSDAIRAGYRQFGNVPFLVKQILEVDCPANFVSDLLAI
jgi:hypothetical protein